MLKIVFGKKKKINLPTKWDEVHPRTISIFVKEYFLQRDKLFIENPEDGKLYHNDVVAYDGMRVNLLQSMLNLPDKEFQKIGIQERHKLLNKEKLVEFMFDTQMVKQPIDFFKTGLTPIFGPADFNKIAAEEFSFADAACTGFIKTGNPFLLDTLIATLFRPKKFLWFIEKRNPKSNGDCRQDFNKHLLDNRIKKASKISEEGKLAVFWWFHSSRCTLAVKYPNLFSPSNQSSGGSNSLGWLNIILLLSQQGTFGTYDKVTKTPMHLLLTDLEQRATKNQTP